jgi:hypothetical protein
MEKKIFESRLETLLLHKDFNALPAEEKKYVLAYLTEDEYREYSLLLPNYKPALLTDYDNVQPSPKVLETLTHAFKTQHQQKTAFDFIPDWRLLSVAAAVLILIGYVIVFLPFDKKKQPIVAKTNKQQPVNLHKAVKQEPVTQTNLTKNYSHNPGKMHTFFTAKNTADNLCLDITIDSLDMPCLNPMTTMLTIADPDDDSNGF